MDARISTDLQDLVEPIEDLSPHEDNPRRGDIDRITRSLERFGQVRPIVCTDDGVIIAGNHTYLAAQNLGWPQIAAVRVTMTEDEAEAYLIADNHASDGATWDDENLVRVLEDLRSKEMLEWTGFTHDDLDDLIAAIDAVPETSPEEFTGDYAEPPEVTAARWEGRNEGMNREIVFLLPEEQYEEFIGHVKRLKEFLEEESMAQTIFRVIREAATSATYTGS
jgi:hypothetical protein